MRQPVFISRLQLKCDGTQWRTGGEVNGGNWRMEWVASTLHTTSEHGVSSITTADAHTSAAGSRLNWRPRRFKWTRPFRRQTKSGFLRVCHHISTGLYILNGRAHCVAVCPFSDSVTVLCQQDCNKTVWNMASCWNRTPEVARSLPPPAPHL
jgi:hypothetical protein